MALLVPMRTERFDAFVDLGVTEYARDNVAAGRWPEQDAVTLARTEFASLVPQGIATAGHFFYEIVPPEAGQTAGYVWFATMQRGSRKIAHVFQLHVLPAFRRRGLGRAALLEAEALARASGHAAMSLNVFAPNAPARALYEALAYRPTSISMAKDLP